MRSSSSLTREVCPARPVTRLYTSTKSPMPLWQQQRGVGVRAEQAGVAGHTGLECQNRKASAQHQQ